MSRQESQERAVENPILPLTHDDEPWLYALSGEEVTDGWLGYANDLVVGGAASRPDAARQITPQQRHCRAVLYDDLFGFGRRDAPSFGLDERLVAKEGAHAPPNRFIAIMRLYHREGLNIVRTGRGFPEIWTLRDTTVEGRIADLKASLGAENGLELIEGWSGVLGHADYTRRIEIAQRVASLLGRPSEYVVKTLLSKKMVLSSSRPKLSVNLRYIADFSPQDVTPSQIGNLLMENPDKHLVTVDRGFEYTHSYIQKATRGMTAAECRTEALEIMADPQRSKVVDERTTFVHRRYHALSRAPRGTAG